VASELAACAHRQRHGVGLDSICGRRPKSPSAHPNQWPWWDDERTSSIGPGTTEAPFRMGSAPTNATIMVAGDVFFLSPEETLTLCEKYMTDSVSRASSMVRHWSLNSGRTRGNCAPDVSQLPLVLGATTCEDEQPDITALNGFLPTVLFQVREFANVSAPGVQDQIALDVSSSSVGA